MFCLQLFLGLSKALPDLFWRNFYQRFAPKTKFCCFYSVKRYPIFCFYLALFLINWVITSQKAWNFKNFWLGTIWKSGAKYRKIFYSFVISNQQLRAPIMFWKVSVFNGSFEEQNWDVCRRLSLGLVVVWKLAAIRPRSTRQLPIHLSSRISLLGFQPKIHGEWLNFFRPN